MFLEKPVKGEKHSLKIDLSHLYVFDCETQLTLLARDGGYIPDEKNSDSDFVPLTREETEERIRQFTPPENKPKKKR